MNQHLHAGTHPDADQISTFLEGRATESERAHMLEHIAACGSCRDMVFLAGAAEAGETAPAVEPAPPAPRRWWLPFGFAGAVAACALIALVFYVQRPSGPRQQQLSKLEQPPNVPPAPATAENANPHQPSELTKASRRSELPAPRKLEGRGSGAGLGAGAAGGVMGGISALQASPPASPEIAGRNLAVLAPAPVEAPAQRNRLAAPKPAAPPAVAIPEAAPEQRAATNFAAPAQQNAASPLGGPLANNQALNALPPLRIEHNRGPADGFSQLTGVVTDLSGAAVPQATVALASADGASVKKVATGPDGRFMVPNVPPGNYELRVSAPGFLQNSEQLDLKPRDLALVNSVLQVGAASETVAVAATAPQVQTAQAEVSANVSPASHAVAGSAPPPSRVEIGGRILRLDADGVVYLSRDGGKNWKKVHPRWSGKAVQLETASSGSIPAEKTTAAGDVPSAQFFQITTEPGQVWTSADGVHWKLR